MLYLVQPVVVRTLRPCRLDLTRVQPDLLGQLQEHLTRTDIPALLVIRFEDPFMEPAKDVFPGIASMLAEGHREVGIRDVVRYRDRAAERRGLVAYVLFHTLGMPQAALPARDAFRGQCGPKLKGDRHHSDAVLGAHLLEPEPVDVAEGSAVVEEQKDAWARRVGPV